MQAILRTSDMFKVVVASALVATQTVARAQNATVPNNLPNAKAYEKFAWPPVGNLFGDVPGTLIFADTRGDQSALKLYVRRADAAWGYLPGDKTPHIQIVVALPNKDPYGSEAALLGYDRAGNGYVQVSGDTAHKDRVVAQVDPSGAVKITAQAPSNLWNPGSGASSPFSAQALGKTKSATVGMILGDDRAAISQKQGMSKGKVSWTYNKPSNQPDEIRVVLMKADGSVRSPHAELKGFDSDKNAYVQLVTDIQEFNGKFYRIDPDGMPSAIDALPKGLWQPAAVAPEIEATKPPPAIAPQGPVVALAGGKFSVTFTDPSTNQQTSAEMERLAASNDPDTPFDGVYHNEKYMVRIRGTDIRVTPNRIPMGSKVPARPAN